MLYPWYSISKIINTTRCDYYIMSFVVHPLNSLLEAYTNDWYLLYKRKLCVFCTRGELWTLSQ